MGMQDGGLNEGRGDLALALEEVVGKQVEVSRTPHPCTNLILRQGIIFGHISYLKQFQNEHSTIGHLVVYKEGVWWTDRAKVTDGSDWAAVRNDTSSLARPSCSPGIRSHECVRA